MIKAREAIKDLIPYKPGKPIKDVEKEYNISNIIKLASNENCLGCSPLAKEAIINAVSKIELYPDGGVKELREAISRKFGVGEECVLVANGSDEMVDIIAKAFVNSEDEIIMSDYTFPRYQMVTAIMAGKAVVVPLKDFKYDLEAMAEKINSNTKVIWICNPNNPTGTSFNEAALEDFLSKVPEDVLVVYDEAYYQYATSEDFPRNSLKFFSKYKNLLILRTFSKIYGLAGLRIGYAIGDSEVITYLNKVRGPFNVNLLAQEAARAALEDDNFIERSFNVNKEGKVYLYGEFDRMGIFYVKTDANHILFRVAKDANEVFVEMQKRGVIVRPMPYKGENYIRVTIGTAEQNKKFVEVLEEVL